MRILLILILATSLARAESVLRVGDILLQPLDCWSCDLIKAEENSIYSHMGVVIEFKGQLMVLEAYGSVNLVSLKKFLSKTQNNAKVKIRRPVNKGLDFSLLNSKALSMIALPYDNSFNWDDEEIYCSELVYKIFPGFVDLAPKMMTFSKNSKLWDKYFNGQTPRGELGVSPEDFNLSSDFYTVGFFEL